MTYEKAHGNYKKTIHLMKKMIDIKKDHLIGNNGLYFRPFFKPYSNNIKKIITDSPVNINPTLFLYFGMLL